MLYIIVTLSILLGLFAGLSVILWLWLKQSEIERKLLVNKVLVRDGQVKLFTEEQIHGKTEHTPKATAEFKSPFRVGLDKTKETIAQSKKSAGLPDSVKEKILEKAEEMKNG